MHTKHDKEGVITMVVTQGLFIMGVLTGNKLIGPRVFNYIDNGKQIQLAPLPSTPPFVYIGNDCIRYPVPEADKSLHALYDKVTHPPPPGLMGTAGPTLVQ